MHRCEEIRTSVRETRRKTNSKRATWTENLSFYYFLKPQPRALSPPHSPPCPARRDVTPRSAIPPGPRKRPGPAALPRRFLPAQPEGAARLPLGPERGLRCGAGAGAGPPRPPQRGGDVGGGRGEPGGGSQRGASLCLLGRRARGRGGRAVGS